MKKNVLITLSLILIAIVSSGQQKSIDVLPFNHLVIDGNFKALLVEDDQPGIVVNGDSRTLKSIKVSQKENGLRISSPSTNHKQIVITIKVKNLESLKVSSEAYVYSEAHLQSSHLFILLDALCYVNIQTNGKISVKSTDDFDLVYSHNLLR